MGICKLLFPVLFCTLLAAKGPEWDRARELYHRTEYLQSLALLMPSAEKDAATLGLIGQNYFMLGEYKKATEVFEKAVAAAPNQAEYIHWLGRAYGRRAETSGPFTAPGYATKSREMFEKAVALNLANKDAVGDLMDYYLEAPGFLGGGLHKADALAKKIAEIDPAEGYYLQALVEQRRKRYDAAEEQLRRAAELAPRQVGRIVVLAKYLAQRGEVKESDAMFEKAMRMAPNTPKVLFERAETLVKGHRNLPEARELLERYLRSPLTPEDPPRERAEALLKKTGV